MQKIDHVGIAVRSLDQAKEVYRNLLNTEVLKEENVEAQKVKVAFFENGDTKVELLEGTDDQSAVSKFVEKRGEGVHHVAYKVGDIKAEMKRLENEGFKLLDEEPRQGANQKWVAFIHPKSSNGVLIELCQPMN